MANIRALAARAGFKGKALDTIVAIVKAESGGNARAHNTNANTGDNSYGLAQINMLGAMGPERRKQFGLKSNDDLFDPLTNLRVAYKMSGGGTNFTPWSTFKSGAYKQHLGSGGTVANAKAGAGGAAASDRQDMAAQYGWALAVLESSPDLKHVFNQAVKNTWSPARFVAEVRNTKWFQTHSEAQRNAAILKKTDPQTWLAKVRASDASIKDMATQLGAQMSDKAIRQITSNVLNYGWNDNQIRDVLAQSVKMGGNGTFGGQAATNVDALRKRAFANGVSIADDTLTKWAQRMAAGEDESGFDQYVRGMAKQAFPTFQKEIDAGMDVQDIAQPYINAQAQTLELDPASINLFDPTIRKALQTADPKTGQVTTKPLWQFEDELRADPRFDKTKQAQLTASKFADALTKTFGAVG